jgi:hypothetical protein
LIEAVGRSLESPQPVVANTVVSAIATATGLLLHRADAGPSAHIPVSSQQSKVHPTNGESSYY